MNRFNYYQQAFFPGQSETFRWREFYFTTYNISYALGFCALSLVASWKFWRLIRSSMRRCEWLTLLKLSISPASMLVLWGSISCLITATFYLRTPAIASRYMLDFAAGFAAMLTGLWCWIGSALASRKSVSKIPISVSILALFTWQAAQMALADNVPASPASVTYEQFPAKDRNIDLPQPPFPSTESWTATSARTSGIPFNGEGWDANTGNTKAAITLFVKDPQCINIEVAPRSGAQLNSQDYECIQAKIGSEFLVRKGIESRADGVQIAFAPPQQRQYQKGIQPLFLAMVKPSDLSTNEFQIRLLKVAWNTNQ